MHRDVTGSAQRFTPRHVAEAERNPVGLLGRLLADAPRLAPIAPTDALAVPAASPAGRRWQDVTRAATLAAQSWHHAGGGRPLGEHTTRLELGDLAALTQGVLAATDDLTDALRRAGRATTADTLDQVRSSGLGIAADQTRRHAEAGPLPPLTGPHPPPPRRPLPVRGPGDLPAAFGRLTHLTATAPVLRPRDVELIAQTIAAAAHHAAQTLTTVGGRGAPGDVALAEVLHRHADLLARATDSTRRLATIEIADPRPVAQAQAIHQHLAAARRTGTPLAADVARAVAAELPDLATALDATTRRQIDRGTWLTPTDGHTPGRPAWTRARDGDEPRLVGALRAAHQHLHDPALAPLLPRPVRPATVTPRPRQILTAALTARQAHPRLDRRAVTANRRPPSARRSR